MRRRKKKRQGRASFVSADAFEYHRARNRPANTHPYHNRRAVSPQSPYRSPYPYPHPAPVSMAYRPPRPPPAPPLPPAMLRTHSLKQVDEDDDDDHRSEFMTASVVELYGTNSMTTAASSRHHLCKLTPSSAGHDWVVQYAATNARRAPKA
jgi:hypothetical protein